MSKSGKFIIFIGCFIIVVLTLCAFFKKDIEYFVTIKNIDRLYGNTSENIYFLEDNFNYVDNAEDAVLISKYN